MSFKIFASVVGDSNDENNFVHKLLLTNTQVSEIRKDFTNGSSANIKLWKIQLHSVGQSDGFLGRLLRPLRKTGLLLLKNVLKPLAKGILTLIRPWIGTETSPTWSALLYKFLVTYPNSIKVGEFS